jgi:hypothetical protein
VQGTSSGVDLMIVDIPEGLPVPIVSSPPTSVLVWNSTDESFLPLVFDFGRSLVHDNGALLLQCLPLLHLEGMDRNKPVATH